MTQSTDNVYLSLSFTNIPRTTAEEIVRRVEQIAGDNDFSVDYGDPIGDSSPTPVFDKTVDETGSAPVSQAPSQNSTDSANTGPAEDPSNPDVQPGVGDSLPPVVEPNPVPAEDPAPTDAEPAPAGATDAPVDTPTDTPADPQPTDGVS